MRCVWMYLLGRIAEYIEYVPAISLSWRLDLRHSFGAIKRI